VKEIQAKSLSQKKDSVTFWDTAISDAEKMLADAKERVSRLKRTITIFKRMRDNGEPFPGENQSKAQNDLAQK